MKRKFTSLLLGMVLVLGLTACGGEDTTQGSTTVNGGQAQQQDKESTENQGAGSNSEAVKESHMKEGNEAGNTAESVTEESTEPAEVVEKEVEEEEFWQSKENLELPTFGTLAVEDKTALDGSISYKISSTPFDYDMDQLEETLKNNDQIKGVYNLSRKNSEALGDFETYTEGDFYTYSTMETINGRLEGEEITTGFYVTLKTDYSLFNNVNRIALYIDNIQQTNLSQEKVYSIVEDVFGSVMADYLVYSAPTPSDPGKNYRLDFYGYVVGEDGTRYAFERNFTNNDTWSAIFSVEIYQPSFSTNNNYTYDNGGKELMYKSAKYTVSDITEGGLSDADFSHFSTMFPEYTGINVGANFIRNGISNFSYGEEVLHNGDIAYTFELLDLSTLLEDVSGYEQPEFDIQYTLKENADGLYGVDVDFRSDSVYRHAETIDGAKVFTSMKEQVAVLMPYVDLSEFVYAEDKSSYTLEGTHTYLGVECDYYISFSIGSKDGYWYARIDSKND